LLVLITGNAFYGLSATSFSCRGIIAGVLVLDGREHEREQDGREG
jgi:hypothetical protein